MADEERKVMVQFHFAGSAPDRAAVAARFNIAEHDIDTDFGVIVTDEREQLATVLVPERVADRMRRQLGEATDLAEGSFSNPRIAPFGPPEDPEDEDAAR